MDAVRLRVVFEDRHILTESQKSDGLKRSWLLLKPQHDTISDLSSYLTHIFDLSHSCPHGIKLSMDGFVLPPFESTCMLKDKDVIRVERKGGILREVVEAGDGPNLIEEEKIVGKQPVATCVPLLTNKEFEMETGGYQSEAEEDEDNQETSGYQHEPEEDEDEDKQSEDPLLVDKSSGGNGVSKKRKASKELHSSKKKKKRTIVPEDIENDSQMEQNDVYNNNVLHPGKNIDKEEKVLDVRSKPKKARTPRKDEKNNDIVEPSSSSKRFGKLQESGSACNHVPHTPDGTRKVPSRSARRKKAKRQWLRELKAELKELHKGESPEKNMPNDYTEQQEQKQNGEAGDEITVDDEIVPIVIRPGHIRFEPLGKGQDVQQSLVSMSQQINVSIGEKSHQHPNKKQKLKEKSQWNAITGKRKGQNWGRENFASSRRNDSNGQHSELMTSERSESQWNTITGTRKGQNWGRENFAYSRRNDYKDSKGQHSELMTSEKLKPSNDPIDFDRLPPLNSLPNEGDVIAYRLVELSSTWSPRLSSFRIGKTMQCDTKSKSKKVLLVPVPEYPIIFDKQTDEDASTQPNNSIYGEDGSLEISFLSLIDVRVVKHGNPFPAKAVTGWDSVASIGNKVSKWNVGPSYANKQIHAPTQASLVGSAENEVNVWDRLIQAQSAKKVQLIHVNSGRNQNSGTRSCSNGALRIGI